MYAKKSLGQHFLRCRWVVSTLIKAADLKLTDAVLEIGPGTGILTRALARHAKRIIAVEKDERLAEKLRFSLAEEGVGNVGIISDDILALVPSLAWHKLQAKIGTKYKVVANIPYYLTSRLVRILLEPEYKPELVVLTIQKEVAQRIVAKPPNMNLLALSVQAFGKPEVVKTVPANCFWPKPKVDSAIIKVSGVSDRFFVENGVDKNFFFEIVRRAFSQKRKMLASSLRSYSDQHRELTKAHLPNKARPQELSLKQWVKIVRELSTAAKKTD